MNSLAVIPTSTQVPTQEPALGSDSPFQDGIDPDQVIAILKDLPATDLGYNHRPFYRSYPAFAKLSIMQRCKLCSFFRNLSKEVRARVTAEARHRSATYKNVARNASKGPCTTADDRARILHMIVDPGLAPLWIRAQQPTDLQELDASTSGSSVWDELAVQFNDYSANSYSNKCAMFDSNYGYVAVSKYESIAGYVHAINPSNRERPGRDGEWLQREYRQIRAHISRVYEKLRRSGHYDTAELPELWHQYCFDYPAHIIYAIAVIPLSQMPFEGNQRKTYSNSAAAVYKRRQRMRLQEVLLRLSGQMNNNSSNNLTPSEGRNPAVVRGPNVGSRPVFGADVPCRELIELAFKFGPEESKAALMEVLKEEVYASLSGHKRGLEEHFQSEAYPSSAPAVYKRRQRMRLEEMLLRPSGQMNNNSSNNLAPSAGRNLTVVRGPYVSSRPVFGADVPCRKLVELAFKFRPEESKAALMEVIKDLVHASLSGRKRGLEEHFQSEATPRTSSF